ncbi:MAG: hypothetical protein ACRDJV_14775 [Actinomycetota bacterium]
MNAFVIELKNIPGEMARVTETLAEKGINVLPCGFGAADQFLLGFVAADEDGSRTALKNTGIPFRQLPVVAVNLEDRPGTAAAASRTLADAGVNIEAFFPVGCEEGRYTFGVCVDDVETARRALGDQVVEFTYR